MMYHFFKYTLLLLFPFQLLFGQSVKQEKMEQLSYMIGEWVGTSTLYEDGKITKQVPAFERISYDLNQSIIVIELHSETLKLHTIIYYDEEENAYSYNAFSENGGRQNKAQFIDGRLVVQPNEERRYIFEQFGENGFREYGEILVGGQWVKYFEDIFTNTQ
jgi:hypothetical protein